MIYYFVHDFKNENIHNFFNKSLNLINDDDYACFINNKSQFTTYTYGKQLENIISKYKDNCTIFISTSNNNYIDPNNKYDIEYHRKIGEIYLEYKYDYCEDVTLKIFNYSINNLSLFIIKKSTWIEIEKFDDINNTNNLYVDLYMKVLRHNLKIFNLDGVYLYNDNKLVVDKKQDDVIHNTTKFVIITQQRSGGYMLKSALEKHPNIKMFSEYYGKVKQYVYCNYEGLSEDSMYEIYLNAFKLNNPNILASGFIQNRYKHDDVMFLDYLFNDNSVKIIFLDRNNLLKRYISEERSVNKNIWRVNKNEDFTELQPIKFDIKKFILNINNYNERRAFYINKLKTHKIYFTSYEKLIQDYDNEIYNIQKFLNVSFEQLHPSTIKMSKFNIKQSVINYTEMKEDLSKYNLLHYLDNKIEPEI